LIATTFIPVIVGKTVGFASPACQSAATGKEVQMSRFSRRAALATLALPMLAHAQEARPLRLVVPFAAGGSTDVLARVFGERIAAQLGQQVVVENRAGGAGAVGSAVVAQAPPDGNTLLLGTIGTHAVNGLLTASLPYDAVADFTPITLLATLPNVLVVNPGLPVATVAELVGYIRARPGQLAFASPGNGTAAHLAGELFRTALGVDIAHAAYRGSAPLLTDVIGGQVAMAFDYSASALPHIRGGRLRALAVTSDSRTEALPAVPTMVESGFDGVRVTTWYGIFAPRGLPAPLVARLHGAFAAAAQDAALRARLAELSVTPVVGTPAALAAFQREEIARWGALVRSARITAE